MNCAEFENYLPEIVDGTHIQGAEQHLSSCAQCSNLAADLRAISQSARELQEFDTPHARVWHSLEAALRQEGLIREPSPRPFLVASAPRRWQPAWLLPVAAAFLMVFGTLVYQRGIPQPRMAETAAGVAGSSAGELVAEADDQGLLEAVAERSPAMRTTYEADLNDANSYIRDVKTIVDNDPNDEQAQSALAAAYEQRSMIYQMALDRSLP